MEKLAIIFGGRSGEHQVSLVSATSVIGAVDKTKYDIVEIGITEQGVWLTGDNCLTKFKSADFDGLNEVAAKMNADAPGFWVGSRDDGYFMKIDIAFPVLHGPFGEDGTIQGVFEMLNIPYVGCGVLASSTAMDKLQCKAIWKAAGLPVVPYVGFLRSEWENDKEGIKKNILQEIGVPCFVKPANMGSSVGISKVKSENQLASAIDYAAKYDRRILVEVAIDAREIECAVLGNDSPIASPLGEILVGGEFYDFHDKYVNGVSQTQVPADLPADLASKIQKICLDAYMTLDCSGLSRADCFVDRKSGKVYVNELNTLPGFTSISMYPKMMAAHGMDYPELIEKLLNLALERFEDKQKNQIIFDSGSDWYKEN